MCFTPPPRDIFKNLSIPMELKNPKVSCFYNLHNLIHFSMNFFNPSQDQHYFDAIRTGKRGWLPPPPYPILNGLSDDSSIPT